MLVDAQSSQEILPQVISLFQSAGRHGVQL